MNLKIAAVIAVVGLFAMDAGEAQADGIGDCVSACTQACNAQGAGPACGKGCVTACKPQDISAPQHLFTKGVISVPQPACVEDTNIDRLCGGYDVSGTVANQELCGGRITFYQVCPDERGTTTIGSTGVNADCTFALSLPAGPGQNGCFGLIGVTAPPPPITAPIPDPGWSTCTGGACPNP
jgi:hypothetical protein